MNLKLYIKQTDQVTALGQQIHYAGVNPQSLNLVNGGLPIDRQFPNYGSWVDVTAEASDLFDLSITFTTERDTDGVVVPGGLNSKKAAAGTITLEGSARQLLKKWLFDDVSAQLNRVDVKIEHVGCGTYEGFVITSYDVRWCEDDSCIIDVSLKLKEATETCIRSTIISDNHQGWFQTEPANGLKHPRFSYCNEVRPNGLLIMQWYVAMMTMITTFFMLVSLLPIINSIIFIINLVNSILGTGSGNPIGYLDPNDLIDAFRTYFIESAGCGREHPAPFIRDYIQNVCDKCGVKVTPETVPIFFNPSFWSPSGSFMESSSGEARGDNPHYNACYLTATVKRGVRRFRSLNAAAPDPDSTTFYIPENAPIEALDQFLDRLKMVYNAEWRIKYVNNEPTLYFWRKDFFLTGSNGTLFDFSTRGADRNLLLEGVCFEVTEKRNFASAKGIYSPDAADTCGNEALSHMNGYVSFGNTDENPTFEGIKDLTAQFGGTKFRLDGASTDYVYDALQVISNSSAFTLPFFNGIIRDFIYPGFDKYADYALLMSDETSTLPKILLWNPDSGYENAKCYNNVSAWNGNNNFGANEPSINTYYNNFPFSMTWGMKHVPETFVIGSNLSFGSNPIGEYIVQDYFGIDLAHKPALLINYNMYFAPEYTGSLWDWFHWIDDPKRNPRLNFAVSGKIELCCDNLLRLEPFNNSENVQLGSIMKVNKDYQNEAVITEIGIHYNSSDEDSRYIELKGVI